MKKAVQLKYTGNCENVCSGALGGAVVKRLPSAQGVIPAFQNRVQSHIGLLRWEPASSSPTPLLCSLSHWLSLCHINK